MINVFRTEDEQALRKAVVPTVNHKGDAGMDFYALGSWQVKAHQSQVIRTGFGVIVPDGYVGILKPKSKNNHLVGAGVIDSNYRGEILFKIFNPYEMPFTIEHGQPVGQMVILKCLDPDPVVIIDKELIDDTNRGESGGIHEERRIWD